MLLLEELPPTAPQPNVMAGNRPVVMPTPPMDAGVLTKKRLTGTALEKRSTTASSRAWRAKVCPLPSWRRMAQESLSASSSLSTW